MHWWLFQLILAGNCRVSQYFLCHLSVSPEKMIYLLVIHVIWDSCASQNNIKNAQTDGGYDHAVRKHPFIVSIAIVDLFVCYQCDEIQRIISFYLLYFVALLCYYVIELRVHQIVFTLSTLTSISKFVKNSVGRKKWAVRFYALTWHKYECSLCNIMLKYKWILWRSRQVTCEHLEFVFDSGQTAFDSNDDIKMWHLSSVIEI